MFSVVDEKPALNDLQYMLIEDGKSHFRLMDRLQPHWRSFAIALRFPQHKITNMEHNDNPVLYLLKEWLHGANKEEDRRPELPGERSSKLYVRPTIMKKLTSWRNTLF